MIASMSKQSQHTKIPSDIPDQILQDIKTAHNDVPNLVGSYPEFTCETHKVTTCDGYILSIHRLRHKNKILSKNQFPVLLQHGLLADSALWILNGGDENSLGFALALAGYDVWMANSRGNTYSREHETMSGWNPLHLKYWDFSFEDMALYDLPATVDYILGETDSHQIHYVGHSQGTLIMFIAMDEYGVDFQDKIATFSAIAPIAFMVNATSPLATFAKSSLASLCYTNVWAVVGQKYTGLVGDFIVKKFTDSLANSSREAGGSKTLLAKVVGFFPERYHPDKLQGYVKHISSGTSIKDLFHFGQIIRAGKPTKFSIRDWTFSVSEGKSYNLNRIQNKKIDIYCGLDDSLSYHEDISILEELLRTQNNEVRRFDFEKYDHMSLVWAKDVYEKINRKIIDSLEGFTKSIVPEIINE